MAKVLFVSSSAYLGNVGWAWSSDESSASGSFTEGSAYRGAMAAAVEGLKGLPEGTEVAIQTSNETLASVGRDWMSSWRERDWDKKGGIKHLDLVKQLSVEDMRLQLTWTLRKSNEAEFKAVKAIAQAARKTLPPPPEGAAKSSKETLVQPVAPTTMRTVAYTDGGCRGGIGGWGLLLIDTRSGAALERWGGERDSTNNRMEMQAAIEVLRTMKGRGQSIEIRTDSKYLKDTATKWLESWKRNGWRKFDGEPISNPDLVQEIDRLQSQHQVLWTWVRGHQGEPGNEHVDDLATRGMNACDKGEEAFGQTRFAVSPVVIPKS